MERWNEFFFAREAPLPLALVRITLPPVLLLGVLQRAFHVRELYSTDGAPTPLWINYGTGPLLPNLSAPVAIALYAMLIVSLLTAMMGWRTRLSLLVACALYTLFGLIDSVSTLTKYTVIGAHLLLILSLSECGAIWSIDAWLGQAGRTRRSWSMVPKSEVWPRRLIQLFIGLVYVGAALTKMHTPAYFTGDQLTSWMLANLNMENRLGEWLTFYPPLITVMSYVTILWEVLFITLVWSRFWRIPVLVIGIVFHAMTYFTLGLVDFPLIYFSAYCIYLEPGEIERIAVGLRRFVRSMGAPLLRQFSFKLPAPAHSLRSLSFAGWSMVMLAAAAISVELERRADVYGRRSPSGPPTLQPMNAGLAAEMLGPTKRVRPQDMYYAFDVGTSMLGGLLSDRKASFRYGEQAIMQCTVQPPHPDMWVEVTVNDEQDRVVRRFGQVVPRENLRADFYYAFDESFVPGDYDFVLHYRGEELTRRRVTLVEQPPALTASR